MTTPSKRFTAMYERSNVDATCEQAEAILYQFESDSVECLSSVRYNWQCGCNDGFNPYAGSETTQDKFVILLLLRISAGLSILGSFYIMQDYCLRRYRKRKVLAVARNGNGAVVPAGGCSNKTIYRQVMFCMSMFDFISASAWMIGPLAAPTKDLDGNDTNVYGARGNDLTCTLQVSWHIHYRLGLVFFKFVGFDHCSFFFFFAGFLGHGRLRFDLLQHEFVGVLHHDCSVGYEELSNLATEKVPSRWPDSCLSHPCVLWHTVFSTRLRRMLGPAISMVGSQSSHVHFWQLLVVPDRTGDDDMPSIGLPKGTASIPSSKEMEV